MVRLPSELSAKNGTLDESFEKLCLARPDLALRQLAGDAYDETWKDAEVNGLSYEDCKQGLNMKVLLWRYDCFPEITSMPLDKKMNVVKWESSPFNILTQRTGKMALIEYLVWKEYPDKANMKLVITTINNLVSHLEKNNGKELLDGFCNDPFFSWLPWKKLIS